MRCPTCATEMGKKHAAYQYKESGLENIWLEDCLMYLCPTCNITMPMLPSSDLTTKAITLGLVRQKGRLDGDSIVFLRKSMGLKAAELADVLGVDRVTVSRWENNKQEIEAFYDFRLRMAAIDRILPVQNRKDALLTVARILQNSYIHAEAISNSKICVPAANDLELAFA